MPRAGRATPAVGSPSPMSKQHYLVTGGTGFIGSALVIRLVREGHRVRVLDNNSRGAERRLASVIRDIELISGDVRDPDVVKKAIRGADAVHHLAYVNGTENFYKIPELVLEIGVKGMINVIDGCLAAGVGTLFLASSSEVYQTPPHVPTNETVPLIVPDPMNPRYSYGGGKIISELLAINYGRKHFERIGIYRPHNVYGPDMGWEHVLPQFTLRLRSLVQQEPHGRLRFPIQGSGKETRSFCHIDDFIDGVITVQQRGEHLAIYHIGTLEEVTVADLAARVARCVGREIEVLPGTLAQGSTPRRCPDISKLTALGYVPRVSLDKGLRTLVDWYWQNYELAPAV
jgi:nucleoside-diphosphate-sugar epimerase